ncbi:unnamed protein product [Lupinus luteus]|uniref:Pentatricopeptide repeat-containing protein n=1 Tax=Lupinus luteus TaxID=3873 RepID=A0AAV1XUA7_LUPLU
MSTSHLIKQCKSIAQLHQIHAHTITIGLHTIPILINILSTFTNLLTSHHSNSNITSSTSLLSYSLSLFHSIPNPTTFSYNNLIRIHTLLFSPLSALHLFSSLRRHSLPPDFHTFPFILKACPRLPLSLTLSLHSQAFKFGFLSHFFTLNSFIRVYSFHRNTHDAHKLFSESPHRNVVSYNAMVDGYVKTGQISLARKLFDEMPERDSVSWGTMIAGYSQANLCSEAIQLFNEMLGLEMVKPDNIALVSVLSACAKLGEVEQGCVVHDYIRRNGTRVDSYLATGLVDFYAKCGYLETASDVFESCKDKNVFTWNSMLVALAIHGKGSVLIEYFSRMIQEGFQPDGITFLGVLAGCSHAGLVHEARKFFNEMETLYGVPRESKHYGCMADMLGRAGLIEEAVEMIRGMPSGGNVGAWGGLLGGCRIHGNVAIAKKAAEQMMQIKPEDGGVYSVMANIYAHNEQWDDLVKIRKSLSANKRANKFTGRSLIRSNHMRTC